MSNTQYPKAEIGRIDGSVFDAAGVPLGSYYAIISGQVVPVPDALKDILTVKVHIRPNPTPFVYVARLRDDAAIGVRALRWGGQAIEGSNTCNGPGNALMLQIAQGFANVGDYICQKQNGHRFILPQGAFDALYEVVANTPNPDYRDAESFVPVEPEGKTMPTVIHKSVIHKQVPVRVTVDVDEGIAELVMYLDSLPGVRTHASCQGTIGEGGAAPYRAEVLVSWDNETTLSKLRSEFDVTALGDDGDLSCSQGYVHPRESGVWRMPKTKEK